MRAVKAGPMALQEFSKAAREILQRRVRNSPPKKNEKQWLQGWRNRTASYAHSIL
jgi:hypothetical protein